MDAPVLTLTVEGSPDWETIKQEFHCPLCKYNLRGLTTPRCPECGYQFQWQALIDAERNRHPYLFEHHRKRNVWSFVRTVRAGFRPRKFWTTLQAGHRIHPWRLLIYAVAVSVILFSVLFGISGAIGVWEFTSLYGSINAYVVVFGPSAGASRYWADMWRSIAQDSFPLRLACIAAGWAAATLLTLLIFIRSFHRVGIRMGHPARCAIYCSDVLLLLPLALVFWSGRMVLRPYSNRVEDGSFCALCLLMLGAIVGYRLFIAIQDYLRFKHALAMAVASQFIVWLAALIVLGDQAVYGIYNLFW